MEQVPAYALARRGNANNKFVHKDVVKRIIGDFFDTTYEAVAVVTRKREIVYVRQMMMFFLAKYTCLTLESIGDMFGGKDHTTVIHSVDTIKDLSDAYPAVKDQVDRITQQILVCDSE